MFDDAADIDLELALLKAEPLKALQSLQSKLPQLAPQLRRQRHLLCPLCCSGDDEVAAAAAKLLDQLAEPEATFCGGRRTFHYRGIEVEYWELDEDPGDLLFGYGAWPVAESLSKLLINSTLSEHDSQVVPSVHGKHVLEIGVEQFDIIVASDVLLCCCGAPEALPAVLSRRLKLDGKALLLNVLRGARAQLIAISLLQRHGFLVSIFAVASLDMLPLSTEQISKLPDAAHVLLVVTWAEEQMPLPASTT